MPGAASTVVDAEVLKFQQENKVASFEEETKARLIDLSRLQAEHWASQGEVEALRLARSGFPGWRSTPRRRP